jgi:hypothetical protein
MGGLIRMPDERDRGLALTRWPRLNLEVRVSIHQILELGESPGARIEVGRGSRQIAANRAKVRPAIIAGGNLDGFSQQSVKFAVTRQRWLRLRFGLDRVDSEVLDIDERVTGRHEWLGGLAFPEAYTISPCS